VNRVSTQGALYEPEMVCEAREMSGGPFPFDDAIYVDQPHPDSEIPIYGI
jgi:hypothetical protein